MLCGSTGEDCLDPSAEMKQNCLQKRGRNDRAQERLRPYQPGQDRHRQAWAAPTLRVRVRRPMNRSLTVSRAPWPRTWATTWRSIETSMRTRIRP